MSNRQQRRFTVSNTVILLFLIVGVCIALWALTGGFSPRAARVSRSCPSDPSAPLGTIKGYDASDGHHGVINIWSSYGQSGASVVAKANEGDQVWMLRRSSDGGVQVETKSCVQGWVDSEFIE